MNDGQLLSCDDVLETVRPLFRDSRATLQERFGPGTNEFTRVYTSVYTACTHNYSEAIYRFLVSEFTLIAIQDDLHVDVLGSAWQEFGWRVGLIQHCCKYLDRFYVKIRDLPCLQEVGTTAFVRAVVARSQPIRLVTAPFRSDEAEERLRVLLHPQIRALDQVVPQGDSTVNLIDLFVAMLLEQKARIASLISRWRRGAFQVGRISRFMRSIYTEVQFRPGGAGAKRAREEFEQYAS
jgi:hypothetical protein